uniref:Uncharacterized protein n=1 Tax=viral metagenome TaxID=1070528 RepID=A0A6C0IBP5_9ZZZZ
MISSIIGARQQNPYTNIPRLNNPLFPSIVEVSKTQIRNKKSSMFVATMNSDIAESILFKLQPKEFKPIYGFSLDDDGKGAIRDFLEPVIANQQCINAGIKFIQKKTVCWLCGCVITESGRGKACEHIIPALRAVMLKGLITTKTITNTVYDAVTDVNAYQKIVKDNYLWAHANCNGSAGKTNMVLIKYDKVSRSFIPDEELCAELNGKIDNVRGNKNICYYSGIDYTGNKNIVRSPYEAYMVEMAYQCKSINDEFSTFNHDLPSFCEYALNRAKLFMKKEGLLAMMSVEEKQKILLETQLNEYKILQEQYNELNDYYELIKKDSLLAKDYLIQLLSHPRATVSIQSLEQKIAYYGEAVQLYLNFYNLESFENEDFKENIMNRLKSPIGQKLMNIIPLEIMLTLVCILTQIVIFFSPNGQDKLLITNNYIDIDKRVNDYIAPIIRFRKGRVAKNRVVSEDIQRYLFINTDGTPNMDRFKNHLCDYIAIFFVQLIIYDWIHSNSELLSALNTITPSSEIQPVPVSINTELLNTLKQHISGFPDYIKPYVDKIWNPESEIYQSLNVLIFSPTNSEISICIETINKQINKRFINPGETMVNAFNPDTGKYESREVNPTNGYSEDFFSIISDFDKFVETQNMGNEINIDEIEKEQLIQLIKLYVSSRNLDEETSKYIVEYYEQRGGKKTKHHFHNIRHKPKTYKKRSRCGKQVAMSPSKRKPNTRRKSRIHRF